MIEGFADKLFRNIERCGTCACVGIDPVFERFPWYLRCKSKSNATRAKSILEFCKGVVDAVVDHVALIKLNIAFFEPYRGPGIEAYHAAVRYGHKRGLLVIGDIKRGDIGHSSASYAAAHLVGEGPDDPAIPDAVTISGYLGLDGVAPFIEVATQMGRGIFILVHTSNESASQLQHLKLQNGPMVVEAMACLVHDWGLDSIGDCGYSNIGAVSAPGDVDTAKKLRKLMPNSILLVPGFGTQGRSIGQVGACFDSKGWGAIVNASRSVTYTFDTNIIKPAERWLDDVECACEEFVKALGAIRHHH